MQPEDSQRTLAELQPTFPDSKERRFVGKWVADFEGAVFEDGQSRQLFLIDAPDGYQEFLFPENMRFHHPVEGFDYECFFVTLLAVPRSPSELQSPNVPILLVRKLDSYSIPAPKDRIYESCLESLP